MMSDGSRFSVSSWVKLGYSAYAISRALVLLPVSKEINQDCGQEPKPSCTIMFVMLTIACQVLNLTGGASSIRGASLISLNQSWSVSEVRIYLSFATPCVGLTCALANNVFCWL